MAGESLLNVRANWQDGVLDSGIDNVQTGLSSPEFANLPVVLAPATLRLVLDHDEVNGAPEVVWVTDHTAASTTATVLRGQEGSAARAHPVGPEISSWLHGLTAAELDDVVDEIVADKAALATHDGGGGATHALAVASAANGFMSGTDKAKLDGLDETTYVKLTGDQSIAGNKTFTGDVLLPAGVPATDRSAAPKDYIDAQDHHAIFDPGAKDDTNPLNHDKFDEVPTDAQLYGRRDGAWNAIGIDFYSKDLTYTKTEADAITDVRYSDPANGEPGYKIHIGGTEPALPDGEIWFDTV